MVQVRVPNKDRALNIHLHCNRPLPPLHRRLEDQLVEEVHDGLDLRGVATNVVGPDHREDDQGR